MWATPGFLERVLMGLGGMGGDAPGPLVSAAPFAAGNAAVLEQRNGLGYKRKKKRPNKDDVNREAPTAFSH
jgi:hypothetical protein